MGEKQNINHLLNNLLARIKRHKQTLLALIWQEFAIHNLQPKIGIELEFYLLNCGLPANSKLTQKFICSLKSAISQHNILLQDIEPEQGFGQVEVKTLPYFDILQLAHDINKIKEIAQNLHSDFQTDFSSQPYLEDCGNSLQINFSLLQNDNFLFAKNANEESKYLLGSIAALLKFSKNMMLVFAPEAKDYQRFDLELNRNLYKKQKYTAPVNISWGYNNRTALIRIPSTQKISERRLEFRLGAGSADIFLTSIFFLLAILEGIKSKIDLPEKIYGNSFDNQYNLENLPNYEEAQSYFLNGDLINKILFILKSNKLD